MAFSRRAWLQTLGVTSVIGAAASRLGGQTPKSLAGAHENHSMGLVGRVSSDQLSPSRYLRTWNFSDLDPAQRSKYYNETTRPDGSLLREYHIYAADHGFNCTDRSSYDAAAAHVAFGRTLAFFRNHLG